jgi:hypothetical protein
MVYGEIKMMLRNLRKSKEVIKDLKKVKMMV